MNKLNVASVDPGQGITFNAGRSIFCQRITTTLFLHVDALIYEVMDESIDPRTGKRAETVQTRDYYRNQHLEGALTMGAANAYLGPKEYKAKSSGDVIEWTVYANRFQPTVSDNSSSFKYVKVMIPESDARLYIMKRKFDVRR